MSVHHERIISGMLRSLQAGCPVVTADGAQIGTLSEVADEAIKVNAPMRRDFWIDADYVRSCDDGRIELSFIKQDLGVYRMGQPTAHSVPGTSRTPAPVDDMHDERVTVSRQAGISFPGVPDESINDAKPATDPLVQGKADHIISDAEQLETRLRMERELAEQRQELPHLHPRGEDGPPDTFGTLGEPVEHELSRYGIDAPAVSTGAASAPAKGSVPYARFLAVGAAVVPLAAAAFWLRRRRRR